MENTIIESAPNEIARKIFFIWIQLNHFKTVDCRNDISFCNISLMLSNFSITSWRIAIHRICVLCGNISQNILVPNIKIVVSGRQVFWTGNCFRQTGCFYDSCPRGWTTRRRTGRSGKIITYNCCAVCCSQCERNGLVSGGIAGFVIDCKRTRRPWLIQEKRLHWNRSILRLAAPVTDAQPPIRT